MLTIKNLYAGYSRDNPILKGIDLTINDGEVVGILGRNGSGKSTLAKAICGLTPYVNGEIFLNGKQILGKPPFEIARMFVGFFQQGGIVFRNLTVMENIYFACSGLKSIEKKERIKQIKGLFEILHRPDRLRMKASYLSGGEKHQLALAMVLIQNPKFIILDEPSAGLSYGNQKSIFNLLKKIESEEKTSMLIIEQNIQIARDFSPVNFKLVNGRFEKED
jgi:branched-chain amino acid transport system ATP-binding protein